MLLAVISCNFGAVWHPTHSNRLRIGAGLGHQNTCCQLCWGARWPWMRCGARPWRQVKWKTYRWSSWRLRPGAMFIMCSSISSTKLQEQERKCSELAMECEDLKAGGWWCWWLVVVRSWWSVYLGCLALFLSRWNWRCGRDKSWHQSRRVELHRGSQCGWLMCISRCPKSRENNRIQ